MREKFLYIQIKKDNFQKFQKYNFIFKETFYVQNSRGCSYLWMQEFLCRSDYVVISFYLSYTIALTLKSHFLYYVTPKQECLRTEIKEALCKLYIILMGQILLNVTSYFYETLIPFNKQISVICEHTKYISSLPILLTTNLTPESKIWQCEVVSKKAAVTVVHLSKLFDKKK